MQVNFNQVMTEILRHEGGYADHPKDPGGATNMGITHKTLARWRNVSPWFNLPKSEVKNLTREEVIRIYRAQYADVIRFDELPSGLDYAVLDFAVNSGPDRAIRALQNLLGVSADGVVGPLTIGAAKNHKDIRTLINRYQDDRLRFLQSLSTFSTFGKGWTTRVASVRKFALELADSTVTPGSAGNTGTVGSAGGFNLAALIPIILTILTAVFGFFRSK